MEGEEETPVSVHAIELRKSDQQIFKIVINEDVTTENPSKYVPIADIKLDIVTRNEASPFYELKDDIYALEDENLLVSYDPKGKFGKNYFVCMTEAARNWALSMLSLGEAEKTSILESSTSTGQIVSESLTETTAEEGQEDEHVEEEEEEAAQVMYVPPQPKEWVCLGSDVEIGEEIVIETRPRFVLIFQKELRFYDPNRQVKMNIRTVSDYKMGYAECPPYEDDGFKLQRLEMDKYIQCANPLRTIEVETTYRFPTNVWVQTAPRTMSEKEVQEEEKSPKFVEFLKTVLPRMLIVLQQNELFDTYYDEWTNVGKIDSSLHGRESSQIKEYQSFSDLKYSKDKIVSYVEWHPTISGIVVVSCITRMTFDTRVEKHSKIFMNKNYLLVWSIKDPIHPLLLLEAPDDVQCFSINPLIPQLIIAGCINGQLAMWELTDYMEILRQQKAPTAVNQDVDSEGIKFEQTSTGIPSIHWVASTIFEYTHRASVEFVQWIPDHFEVDPKGYTFVGKTGFCCQFISIGCDGFLSVWDIRPDRQLPMDAKLKAREREMCSTLPATYQFLDNIWRPIYSYEFPGLEKKDRFLPVSASMYETQVFRVPPQQFDLQTVNEMAGLDEVTKVKTNIYFGTIDGKIATAEWVNEKDVKDSEGKIPFRPSQFISPTHGGPVVTVDRSPFFRNIILTVGLWRFAIWREEQVGNPLLRLRSPSKRLTSGKWSLFRPSVFFIGKEDGTLDVWDLHEQSHEPVITHTVSAAPLSCMSLHPRPQNVKDNMLAVADNLGTLHLLILPAYLLNQPPNEMKEIVAFFDSEIECWNHRKQRNEFHKEQKEKYGTRQVPAAPMAEAPKIFGRTESKQTSDDPTYSVYKGYLELEELFLAKINRPR